MSMNVLKMKWVLLVQLSFVSGSLWGSSQDHKKVVCSITINSKDEIEVFKKNLPSKDFLFRELVTTDRDWMKKACQQGVRCDLVIMSGHFGGSFFGVNGFLPLEDMEEASCNSECDGIFHEATEVYLFGCNTLAGKNKDRRSPEEYMRVLREDGYSVAEAQRIAAFLYSPFGAAFYSRMSKVFSKVPRIYGFDGKAPLGAAIRPLLSSYVRSMAPDFYSYLERKSTDSNKIYSSVLQKTNTTQIAGVLSDEIFPACFINSKEHSVYAKLDWIRSNIIAEAQKNKFDTIPLAQHFFRDLKKKAYQLTPEEEQIIEDLSQQEELKTSIQKLRGQLKAMPSVQFQLAEFEHTMRWITGAEFKKIEVSNVVGSDPRTYSREQKDYICSLDRSVDLRFEEVPEALLSQSNFLWALACVKPTDERLLHAMAKYLVKGQDQMALIEIATTISKIKPQSPEIHRLIFAGFQKQTQDSVRWFLAYALGELLEQDNQIQNGLAEALLTTRSLRLAEGIASALGRMRPRHPEIQMKIVKAMEFALYFPDRFDGAEPTPEYLPKSISYALNRIRPTDPEVRNAIENIRNSQSLSQSVQLNLDLALSGTR